ncbi:hypothetical protein O6H91_22G049200 [Diphasiastrum complanatum]|nr:hypothetical protein O6H91_22G049200 [Diphasiastrum complanatum]
MVWDEFGEADDHIVPNPQYLTQSLWVSSGDCLKRLHSEPAPMSLKNSGQVFQEVVQKTSSYKPSDERNVEKPVFSNSRHRFPDMQARDSLFCANPAAVSNTLLEEEPAPLGGVKEEICTLSPSQLLIKEEISDLGLSRLYMNGSLYREDDSSIMVHSSPFSLFEVVEEESEIELFGAENTVDKGGTLLDNIWDNLDDMDNLFQDGDNSFGPERNDHLDLLQWSSSSQILDGSTIRNSVSSEKCLSTIESSKSEEKVQDNESEKEFNFPDHAPLAFEKDQKTPSKDGFPHFSMGQANEVSQLMNARKLLPQYHDLAGPLYSTSNLHIQETANNGISDSSHISKTDSKEKVMNISFQSHSSAEKGSRARQHALSRRNKFKRESSLRRGHCSTHTSSQAQSISIKEQYLPIKFPQRQWGLTPPMPSSFKGFLPAFQQPLFMLADSFLHQQRPHPRPVLPVGSGPSIYHFPVLVPNASLTGPQLQYCRPLLEGYEHSFMEKQKCDPVSMEVVDAPNYTPFSDNKAGSLERVEKIHLQESMQVTSGAEQPQQKLLYEQVSADPNKNQHEIQLSQDGVSIAAGMTRFMDFSDAEVGLSSLGASRSVAACEETETVKEKETFLEDEALHQLQTIILKLDARTRLCIRDALYRLSKSAMHRHGVGENGSNVGGMKGPLEDTSSPGSISRLTGFNMLDAAGVTLVEAETNRIDRMIANMLFHKASHSPSRPSAPLSGDYAAFNEVSHLPCAPESPWALHSSVSPPQGSWSAACTKIKSVIA